MATPAWQALQRHHDEQASRWHMRDLFAAEKDRFAHFSLVVPGCADGPLLIDYSKNRVSAETMQLLCALARERGVERQRERMFAGEHINVTEDRAVLHTALRRRDPHASLVVDGVDVLAEVRAVLAQMKGTGN